MLGAPLLTWTERRWPEVQEAQIGVVFVLAATGGLLLLAHNPHGGEHLRDLLAGQILWVRWPQIAVLAGVTIGIACYGACCAARARLAFYVLFALAVTASVQLVGVYLVFATLIVPALGARAWPARWLLPVAYAIGVLGYAAGLVHPRCGTCLPARSWSGCWRPSPQSRMRPRPPANPSKLPENPRAYAEGSGTFGGLTCSRQVGTGQLFRIVPSAT